MTPEQKQRAMQMLRRFSQTTPMTRTADNAAVAMAALLQELVDAPESEPFGYFKAEPFGWTDCAETDDGAIALYTAPSEPKPVARVTGYYAGYLSIATVDGRVLPAGTALYLAPPAPSVPDGWRPFLTDVITAAGLLEHGKRDKGLAGRIGKFAFDAMRAAPTPAEPPTDLPTWENGDDPLVGGGLISRGVVDFATVGIWPTKPAPSVLDGWRSAIAKEFPLYDEDGLDEDKHCCEWVMLQERKRLHKMLAAPTPAEAPADVARDAERLRLFEQWTEMGYEHTKEPRFEVETESDVIEITNDERNGAIVPIAEVSTGFNGQIGIEQEANARRIVACVNACEGIPTGVLEKQGMVPIEQVTHDIEQQRDKLLAALTEIAELDILKYHHAYAIAKGAIEEIEALK